LVTERTISRLDTSTTIVSWSIAQLTHQLPTLERYSADLKFPTFLLPLVLAPLPRMHAHLLPA
jgi:hypothetical protein